MNKIKVLLLEDDPILSTEISSYLHSKNIKCETVFDGELFFRKLKNDSFDVYLLDINVPKINGLDVCRQIRENDKITPILMLTAYGEIEDKVEAFNNGADDYLVKPFHMDELLARIQSLFRRKDVPQTQQKILHVGSLSINLDLKKVMREDVEINLTPKEFKLLVILAEANGRVLSKQQIAEVLWDYHIETSHNTIEVYINFLRNKIDKNFENKLIQTKVGFGYYLKDE